MASERKPHPNDDLAALQDVPVALRDLGKAVKEFPAQVSHELRAVEKAYQAGCATGCIATLLLVAVYTRLASWWRNR